MQHQVFFLLLFFVCLFVCFLGLFVCFCFCFALNCFFVGIEGAKCVSLRGQKSKKLPKMADFDHFFASDWGQVGEGPVGSRMGEPKKN